MTMSLPNSHRSAEAEPTARLVHRVMHDGRRVGLSIRFHPETGPTLRGLATWFPPLACWISPAGSPALREALRRLKNIPTRPHEHYSARETYERILQAGSAPDPALFTTRLSARIFVLDNGGYVFESGYDGLTAHALQGIGAKRGRQKRMWLIPPQPLPAVTDALKRIAGLYGEALYVHPETLNLERLLSAVDKHPTLSLADAALVATQPVLQMTGSADSQARELDELDLAIGCPFKRLEVDQDSLSDVSKAMSLDPHQVTAAEFCASRSSSLLADKMGLGKTRSSIAASELVSDAQTCVVTIGTAQTSWAKKILEVLPGCAVQVINNLSQKVTLTARYVVVSYELLSGLVAQGYRPKKIIIDEAHRIKEMVAQRTQHTFQLSESAEWACLLTGTPVLNRPDELHTLLRLSGHRLGAMPLASFIQKFSGHSVLRERLAHAISDWCLRRTREDVGQQLPERRDFVPVVDLTPAAYAEYAEAYAKSYSSTFARMHALRLKAEMLKIDWVASTLRAIGQHEKVLIFCEYVPSVEEYTALLKVLGIRAVSVTGDDSKATRDRSIHAFQNDPRVRGLVATSAVAGESIDLFAARYVFVLGLPWTDGQLEQSICRADRRGRQHELDVYIPLLAGTLDTPHWQLILSKRRLAEEVLVGAADPAEIEQIQKELASTLEAQLPSREEIQLSLCVA